MYQALSTLLSTEQTLKYWLSESDSDKEHY